jgi:predicted MFS family arabinose efflux permease
MKLQRRSRIFYGWIILVGLMAVTLASNAMTGPHRALFVKPMTADLGISLAAFGLAQSAQMVAGSLTAPLRGRIIDRFGARIPLVVAGLLTGMLVMSFSRITAAWHLIALFGLMGIIGLQAGQLYTSVPLAKWFVRRRARVISLVFLGIPVGVMLWSPIAQLLISGVGWRSAWVIMAASGGITVSLIGLLVIRRQPEDMGLLPDGDLPQELGQPGLHTSGEVQRSVSGQPDAEYPWTRSEALHNPAFWKVAIAFGLQMFSMGSLVIFRIPYFMDMDIDRGLVALGLSLEGVAAILVGVALGFVLERVNIRAAGGMGFFLMICAVVSTMLVTQVWQMFIAFFLFGMAIAMLNVVQNVMWPSYFGRTNVGAIRGTAMLVTLPFGALGAPAAGFVRDLTGGYFPAWWAAIVALSLGALLLLSTPSPRPLDFGTPAMRPEAGRGEGH